MSRAVPAQLRFLSSAIRTAMEEVGDRNEPGDPKVALAFRYSKRRGTFGSLSRTGLAMPRMHGRREERPRQSSW
jgi:hypothetical protein